MYTVKRNAPKCLLRTAHTKFNQNRPGFMEDMTKTVWHVFTVHSLVTF